MKADRCTRVRRRRQNGRDCLVHVAAILFTRDVVMDLKVREKMKVKMRKYEKMCVSLRDCMCVCLCVYERERERTEGRRMKEKIPT